MHSSLRGYVTIKRRPAGIYSRAGARIARLPDRSFSSCRAEPQPSVEQFSFFKQRQYVGSWVIVLWHETRTHMVGGGEGRNGGNAGRSRGGVGRGGWRRLPAV